MDYIILVDEFHAELKRLLALAFHLRDDHLATYSLCERDCAQWERDDKLAFLPSSG